jgi:hypothetical protein
MQINKQYNRDFEGYIVHPGGLGHQSRPQAGRGGKPRDQ